MPVTEQDQDAAENFFANWPRVSIPDYLPDALAEAFAAHRQRGAEEGQAVIVAWLESRPANTTGECRHITEFWAECYARQIKAGAHLDIALIDDMEITPEMIEAGDRALGESGVLLNDELTHEKCEQAVCDIYRAMKAKQAPSHMEKRDG